MKNLKNFILKSIKEIDFKLIEIKDPNKEFLNLIKKSKPGTGKKFNELIKDLKPKEKANLVFLTRILDFKLWAFPQNWKKEGYFDLLSKMKKLLKISYEKIDFKIFKKIISPKENKNLAQQRFRLFKEGVTFLKAYDHDFNNYFEEFKKPKDFCFNLMKLRKFKDYYQNFYFLKPNQLLYYEYILAFHKVKQFEKELSELTIFADYKIPQILMHFDLIKPKEKLLQKLKNKIIFKNHAREEIELRTASIMLGEKISEKTKMPSYLIDNLLWELSHKIKLKYPPILVETIFY